MNVNNYIVQTLDKYNLITDDVSYVSYIQGYTFSSIKRYCCSIHSFMESTKNVNSVFDLNWPFEIKIVGNDFWLNYDNSGQLIMHKYPSRPSIYKRPLTIDIVRSILDEN